MYCIKQCHRPVLLVVTLCMNLSQTLFGSVACVKAEKQIVYVNQIHQLLAKIILEIIYQLHELHKLFKKLKMIIIDCADCMTLGRFLMSCCVLPTK